MANEKNTDKEQEQTNQNERPSCYCEIMAEPEKYEKASQPTLFREIYIEQVYKLALLGAIDKDLADFFDVTERTINNWKH